jgi:acyl carrier protein
MERLIQVILRSKSTLEEDDLLASKDLYGDGILDSVDILVVIDELCAEYGFEIGATAFSREDFMSVEAVYAMVKRLGGAEADERL